MMEEKMELWYRNPMECIEELLGNPALKGAVAFEPVKMYTDKEGKERVFNEMWTGEWWWKMQVGFNTGLFSD
jgi:hypothetical protein